jgi:putative hemolysin
MYNKKFYPLLFILSFVLSGCGTRVFETQTEIPLKEPDIGMPNPAAAYCEEQGGQPEIRTDEDGNRYGVCIFVDGSECEEWSYFHGECQPGQLEITPAPGEKIPEKDKPEIGLANPASVYCQEQGGTVEIRTDSSGGQFGVCVFKDGSECDEWAFFNGECQPGTSEVAPGSEKEPAYNNETYGFSFDPPSNWSIEEYENHLIFRYTLEGGDYSLFVGFKWQNEQVDPFRTGMPSGEFIDGEPALMLDQPLPKRLLVYEGKTMLVEFGPNISIGNLQLYIWLDFEPPADQPYGAVGIPQPIITEAEQILDTFELTSDDSYELLIGIQGFQEYQNQEYGFSVKYPIDWTIEEEPNHLVFRWADYFLFVGYHRFNEDVGPFRTGMPAGEFVDGGALPFMGRELMKRYLVMDGRIKVVEYGTDLDANYLRLYIWLDVSGSTDYEIPTDIIALADLIVSSFNLTGGE